MKRRLWKLLALLIALPVLLVLVLQWWAASRLTPEAVVRLLEGSRNCRATVESVSVRMWGFPARVEMHGLKVRPLDESSKPAVPGETFLNVDSAVLEVHLWSLLTGKLDVERANLDGVALQTVKWREGGNSLKLLLAAPGTEARPASLPVTLEDADEIPATDAPTEGEDQPFHISDLPLTSALREARISNVSWTVLNQRKRTVQQFKDANLVLTGMTLDPGNPSEGGRARVVAGTRFIMDSQRLNLRTLDFILSLEGDFQLIDPVTGNLNSDLDFSLTVKRGSLINRIPTLVKLNERLDKLKDSTGLSLDLPPEASLLSDTVIRARLKDKVIRFTDDVFFPFDTYQLALDKESWLSLRDEQHAFSGRLIVSGERSKKTVATLREFVEQRSGVLAKLLNKTLFDNIVTPDGNVEVPFKSSAEIGRPEVALSDKLLNALKRAGTEAGKDLLNDALEGGDDIKSLIDAVKGLRKKPAVP